ncbi:MAG: MarR family transcriptional regulator [Sideroxydans sp.]|nr:MarR family transcriptional regulator [Sideroxydans sp.]
MKTLDEQFAEALHLAAHGWRTALDRRLRPLGYSRSRWMVLLHISRNDGINHRALADLLGIEAPTLVRLIDRMETEGLLKRRACETDRRVKQLHLSPAGRKEVERIWASAADLRKELLSGLSQTEIGVTLNALHNIRAKLENLT